LGPCRGRRRRRGWWRWTPTCSGGSGGSLVTPLDYGAGESGASSSADNMARQQAKWRALGGHGSGGGASCADDDEGCNSPAKRARVLAADDEEPIPTVRANSCPPCVFNFWLFTFPFSPLPQAVPEPPAHRRGMGWRPSLVPTLQLRAHCAHRRHAIRGRAAMTWSAVST